MQILLKHKLLLLSLLSGILVGTSFIPFPPWATAFAFVPLWFVIQKTSSIKNAVFLAWVTQFAFTLVGFNWVAYTAHEFGRIPWIAALAVLIGFSTFANLYVPIAIFVWALIRKKLNPKPTILLLLLPVTTAIAEQFVPTIFPWNFGYTWFAWDFKLFHVAEVIGFQGLSSIMIFCNLLFLIPLLKNNLNLARRWSWVGVFVIVFALLTFWGTWLENKIPKEDKVANVLLAQANIGNLEKVYAFKRGLYREYIVEQFLTLSEEGIKTSDKKIDFIVWPETAFPDEVPEEGGNSSLFFQVANFLNQNSVSLITGAYVYHSKTDQISNSMIYVSSNGQFSDKPYHKTHLLAFGEYFPLGDTFPWLKKLVPSMGNFARGQGPKISELNNILFGSQICYESLFPEFSNKLKKLGSQIIVNVTNDSWFGKYQEPYQHMYMTLARAIENRVPLIRATNTGISTVVTAKGQVLTKSPMHEPWKGVYEVPYYSTTNATFFNQFPHLVTFINVILFALLFGYAVVTRKT